MTPPPPFIVRLAEAAANEPLREKIILCPSQRVGRQWLDQAALLTRGVIGVRPLTLKRLIQDYAEPVLCGRGLRPGGYEERVRLVGVALARMATHTNTADAGYFVRLPASLTLVESLLASLEEMELAGVKGGRAFSAGFRSREKADELSGLWRRYQAARAAAGIAGDAEICRAAATALERKGCEMPLLLLPASLMEECSRLEQRFISGWPEDRLCVLHDDNEPRRIEPSAYVADSMMNEVRGMLRIIRGKGLRLEQVEAVCLTADDYSAALCAAGMEVFGGLPEELPFTFNGGLSGCHSRPVRQLSAWLEWLETDLPPEGLARMLDAELLGEGWRGMAPGMEPARLAERLRSLSINGGLREYGRELAKNRDGGEWAAAEGWLALTVPAILPLAAGGDAPAMNNATALLKAAKNLLRLGTGRDGKLDAYARTALSDAITAWLPHADWPGFNAFAWLRQTAGGLRIMGLGPMPGRLHVSDLYSGGHSGREHTFILGMDDSRHPGTVRQDPVLLDKERWRISPHLSASRTRREQREKALERLLSRIRGNVFISYARYGGDGSRELFPAAAFTRLSGGDPYAETPATLWPGSAGLCLTRRDDWLFLLLGKRGNSLAPEALEPWFPHLARGALALRERASSRFTEWDGRVPEAGEEYRRENWALSPTELETFAACPLDFFFRRILGVRPPKRYEPVPGRWLAGNERGTLLHDLFQGFIGEMLERDELLEDGSREAWQVRLIERIEDALHGQRVLTPPRDHLAYERERGEIWDAGVIFLAEEIARQTRGRPLCLEAALGGAEEDAPPWQRRQPVELLLPSGRRLALRGRVDRIDRLHGHGGLEILDYKTGRSEQFSRSDPFRQGRNLQPFLYVAMLERVLEEAGSPEPVRGFSYFFPMPRDEGRTFAYSRERLREGGDEIVAVLVEMLASGCFPFTTDRNDATFSDYRAVYGDVGQWLWRRGGKRRMIRLWPPGRLCAALPEMPGKSKGGVIVRYQAERPC